MMNENFATLLRKKRLECGLSQKKLAEKAGVSQSAIFQWENGTRMPKLQQINKLSAALGVSPAIFSDYFLDTSAELKNAFNTLLNTSKIFDTDDDNAENEMFYNCELTEEYIISELQKLNLDGQIRLLSHIEDLSRIPEYQKDVQNLRSAFSSDPDHKE